MKRRIFMKKGSKNVAVLLIIAMVISLFSGYVLADVTALQGVDGTDEKGRYIQYSNFAQENLTTNPAEMSSTWTDMDEKIIAATGGINSGNRYYTNEVTTSDGKIAYIEANINVDTAGTYELILGHTGGQQASGATVSVNGAQAAACASPATTASNSQYWDSYGRHEFKAGTNTVRLIASEKGEEPRTLRFDSIRLYSEGSVSPEVSPSAGTAQEVVWTLSQHLDATTFQPAEIKSYSESKTNIFTEDKGIPYLKDENNKAVPYYTMEGWLENGSITTKPTLPKAGMWTVQVYVPFSQNYLENGEITITESGESEPTVLSTQLLADQIDRSASQADNGKWFTLTVHDFKTTTPEIKFSIKNGGQWQYFRVDSIKFIEGAVNTPTPTPTPSPDPEGVVYWTVSEHEDSTEFYPEGIGSWQEATSKIYTSTSGTPYKSGQAYYVTSINGSWIMPTVTLPKTGAYKIALWAPHKQGSQWIRAVIIENGKEVRAINNINTCFEGQWIELQAHDFTTTNPSIRLECYVSGGGYQELRVDTLRFTPCDSSEVTDPSVDPAPSPTPLPAEDPRFVYSNQDEAVFSLEGIYDDFGPVSGSDFGVSQSNQAYYTNVNHSNGLYRFIYTPAGEYKVYVNVPIVNATTTDKMFVDVTDSAGKVTSHLFDTSPGNDAGIKGGDNVYVGTYTFDPSRPGELRMGKRDDEPGENSGHYRCYTVTLEPIEITGEDPAEPTPNPNYSFVLDRSYPNCTVYPGVLNNNNADKLGESWVESTNYYKTEATILTNMKGAYVNYAPYFPEGMTGRYKVYYYNIYKADTAPVSFEVKAGGNVYHPQADIQTGLKNPQWQEIGTFDFTGDYGNEYVRIIATGEDYTRAGPMRFEMVETPKNVSAAKNITLNGSVIAGQPVKVTYDYINNIGHEESGSTYQLYYADSKTPSAWTKAESSGSCTGDAEFTVQLPAETAGKYFKVGITPRNSATGQPEEKEYFSDIFGPVPSEQKAPAASNISIGGSTVAFTELTGNYTYSDENYDKEEGSVYQWYYAGSADAADWTAIDGASGTVSAEEGIKFMIPGNAVGSYLKVGITPKDSAGNSGTESFSNTVGPILPNSDKPAVTALNYGGQIVLAKNNEGFAVGGEIEIDYTYTHGAGVLENKDATQIQWYIGSSKKGSFAPISGAVSDCYTPTEADANKYIRVSIKPVAANGEVGEEFLSDPMLVRWKLGFADEFDYVAKDGYDSQMLKNWYSDEVEYRVLGDPEPVHMMRIPENVETKNGKLYIHNRHETLDKYTQDHDWTTGNIKTKQQFRYGYYESYYKYVPSVGLNQSFWMMSTKGVNEKHVELDFAEGHWPRQIATNIMRYNGNGGTQAYSIKHNDVLPAPETLADNFNKVGGIFRPNDPDYAWDAPENSNTYQVFFNDALLRSTTSLPYEPDLGSIWLTCAIYPAPFTGGALTKNPDGSYAADGTALEYEYVRFFEFLDGTAAAELSASISDAESFLSQMTVSDKFGDYTAAGASALQSAINDAKSALNDPNADEKSLQQALRSIDSAVRTAETAKNLSGTVENNKTYDLSNITREVNIEVPEGVTNVKFIFPQSQLRAQFKVTFDIPNSALKGILTIPAGTKVNGVLELPPISTSQVNGDDTVTTIGFKNVKFENNLSKLELTGINGGQPGVMKNGAFNTIGKITSDSFEAARAAIGNGDHVAFVQSRLAVVYSKCLEEFALYSGQDTTPTPTPTATDNNTNNNGSWTPGGIFIPPNNNQNSDKAQFRDISGHWAEQAIKNLAQKGIIKGKTEKEFMPEDSITRAEFAALIRRAFNLNTVKYENEFADIGDNDWYADEVQTIVDSGIMSGDGNGIFRPNDPISRQEMAKVIVNAYILKTGVTDIEAKNLSFADSYQVDAWAVEYVGKAISLGLITGYDDNTYRPGISMTRAQGAAVISRLLNK